MDSIFDKVRERARMSEVLLRFAGIQLKSGNFCKCPFHTESKGSFSVTKDDKRWTCFGGCGGGDAVQFVEMFEETDTLSAAKKLAEFYEIDEAVSQGKRNGDRKPTRTVSNGVGAFVALVTHEDISPQEVIELSATQLQKNRDT